jgi:DNA-binding CsgD family transcriptional regulator
MRKSLDVFKLTPKQLVIAPHIAAGRDRKTIAAICVISVKTLDIHLAAIRRKLAVDTTQEAHWVLSHYKFSKKSS